MHRRRAGPPPGDQNIYLRVYYIYKLRYIYVCIYIYIYIHIYTLIYVYVYLYKVHPNKKSDRSSFIVVVNPVSFKQVVLRVVVCGVVLVGLTPLTPAGGPSFGRLLTLCLLFPFRTGARRPPLFAGRGVLQAGGRGEPAPDAAHARRRCVRLGARAHRMLGCHRNGLRR